LFLIADIMFSFVNELDERTYILVTIFDENKFFQSDDFMKLMKLCWFKMNETMMLQFVQLKAFVICKTKLIMINFDLVFMMNHINVRCEVI